MNQHYIVADIAFHESSGTHPNETADSLASHFPISAHKPISVTRRAFSHDNVAPYTNYTWGTKYPKGNWNDIESPLQALVIGSHHV